MSGSKPTLPHRRILPIVLVVLALPPAFSQQGPPAGEGNRPGESAKGLDMQAARAKMMVVRGKQVTYTKKFDLSGLPVYKPTRKVSGTIRIWGSNYITDGPLGGYWVEAFRKYQPEVTFEWNMKTTEAAVPSLIFGVSDLGIGRHVTYSEEQLFERYKDHEPLEIDLATGSYDVPGWNPGFGVVVNKDNPLDHISMTQLDGIFGAERTGGWEGTSWHPEYARGPEQNLRTWGQLGLGGDWKDKPIQTYGLNVRYHQSAELSDWILKGSDKWVDTMKIYANYVNKDGALSRNMNEDLAADRYGIGIVASPTGTINRTAVKQPSKILALGRTDAGPFVPYTIDTLQNRTYPMFDRIYAYLDAGSGSGADPRVVEFLKFMVSREGQELVEKDGKYLPLTANVANQDTAKLNAAEK